MEKGYIFKKLANIDRSINT